MNKKINYTIHKWKYHYDIDRYSISCNLIIVSKLGQSKKENDFSNEENSFSTSHHLNRKLQQTITNLTSKQPAKNDSSQRKIDNKEQTDNNKQSQTPTKKM